MSDTLGHDGPCPTGDGGIVMVTVNGPAYARRWEHLGGGGVAGLSGPRGAAVALNQSVLPRSAWQACLSDGARLDVLTAVEGG